MTKDRWWLLAEDDDVDALGVKRVLKAMGEEVRIVRASDGEEALTLLARGEGAPGMILVDLNMPRLGGLGLLEEIRRRPAYDDTPVVVLSTSSQAADIRGADQRGGNGYVVKSLDFTEFKENMKRILAFEQMAGRIQ